jgi:nuclear transport factor 2 (NTF2) superfamily protein
LQAAEGGVAIFCRFARGGGSLPRRAKVRLAMTVGIREETMPGRNPRTADEARAFVAHVEQLFMPWDIDGLLAGFTEDCVVKFGDLPEFRGKAVLEKLFRNRMERQKDYRLKKEFRALAGNVIANYWEGWWEDRVTGAKMHGRGVEVWTMRDGKIAVWEAAFNVNEEGKPSAMGLV